jgi:hypothetical protein
VVSVIAGACQYRCIPPPLVATVQRGRPPLDPVELRSIARIEIHHDEATKVRRQA